MKKSKQMAYSMRTEYLNILKYLYQKLDQVDEKFVDNEIKTKPNLASTYYGFKQIKREKGFSNIEQHISYINQGKETLNKKYIEILNSRRKKITYRIISISSAAAMIGFIISFVIFQLTLTDHTSDELATMQIQYDSLQQEIKTLLPIKEENKTLVAEISQKDSEVISLKSSIEFMEMNPQSVDKIAIFKDFAKKKRVSAELIVNPVDYGISAGGSDVLKVTLTSPINLDFFFINMPMEFKWNTKLKGAATINCYVAKNDDLAFEIDITLEEKSLVIGKEIKNLNSGTYYWMISQEELNSEKQYFVLLP